MANDSARLFAIDAAKLALKRTDRRDPTVDQVRDAFTDLVDGAGSVDADDFDDAFQMAKDNHDLHVSRYEGKANVQVLV